MLYMMVLLGTISDVDDLGMWTVLKLYYDMSCPMERMIYKHGFNDCAVFLPLNWGIF